MRIDTSKVKKVKLIIFQPRLKVEPDFPEWACDVETLYTFAEKAKAAVAKCELALLHSDPKAFTFENGITWEGHYLNPNEKSCQWCKAKAKCPALAKQNLQQVLAPASDEGLFDLDEIAEIESERTGSLENEIKVAITTLKMLDFQTLARFYSVRGLFKTWLDAIEERMLSEMLAGEKHKDFKLIKGRGGNRKWRDADEAEVLLKSMRLKVDEMYDKTIISPTSAEKLLKKNPKKLAAIQKLISRSEGAVQVAPMTSKGVSINPYDDDLALLDDFTMAKLETMIIEPEPKSLMIEDLI